VADGIVYAATGLDGDDTGARGVATVDAVTGELGWRPRVGVREGLKRTFGD